MRASSRSPARLAETRARGARLLAIARCASLPVAALAPTVVLPDGTARRGEGSQRFAVSPDGGRTWGLVPNDPGSVELAWGTARVCANPEGGFDLVAVRKGVDGADMVSRRLRAE